MRKSWVAILGAVAVAVVPIMTSSTASAKTPTRSEAVALSVYNAADPVAALSALSKADQRLFADRMERWQPVEGASQTRTTAPTASGGCWSQYKYYSWYDVGIKTGDTWMTANWCSNGSTITSYSLTGQGGQGYKGIQYNGLGDRYVSNVGWEVRQAQVFKFSILFAHANPCMQIRGGKTGLYSFRANCNLS